MAWNLVAVDSLWIDAYFVFVAFRQQFRVFHEFMPVFHDFFHTSFHEIITASLRYMGLWGIRGKIPTACRCRSELFEISRNVFEKQWFLVCPKLISESLRFVWTFENRRHIMKRKIRKKITAVALVIPGADSCYWKPVVV